MHARGEVVPITDRPEDQRGSPERGPADPGGPESAAPTEQEVRDEISREIHDIYEKSYGKGAGMAEAFVGDGWVIVVLDALGLLPNEEFLVGKGKQDTVAHVRTLYQHAIQAPLRAAVERATGRNVTGFASTTNVDEPRFAVEIFKLD
jgi:uncharacterized protein YbcI